MTSEVEFPFTLSKAHGPTFKSMLEPVKRPHVAVDETFKTKSLLSATTLKDLFCFVCFVFWSIAATLRVQFAR